MRARIFGSIVYQDRPDALIRKMAAQGLETFNDDVVPSLRRVVAWKNDIDIRIVDGADSF